VGRDRRDIDVDLGERRSEIFFNEGLDRANQIESFEEMTVSVPSNI
jgi:hypothetical protein